MNGKKWTEEEINILKNNYHDMTNGEISKLVNHPEGCISKKIRNLNLKRKGYPLIGKGKRLGNNQYVDSWTEDEESMLKRDCLLLSNKELSEELKDRTLGAIKRKLMRMGLKRSKDLLRQMSSKRISGKNHHFYGKNLSELHIRHLEEGQKRRFNDPKQREMMKIYRRFLILPKKDTSIEVKIQNFLKQLGIEFYTHFWINIEHGYQCDILIPSMNLVIQFDGDYWHGNPDKYKVFLEKQKKRKRIDTSQNAYFKKCGFNLLRLWESEFKDVSSLKKRLEPWINQKKLFVAPK